MVWHSYMLNPRDYLEDCARQGRMSLWHCPMPWQAIAQCINNDSFVYQPPDTVHQAFEASVGIEWENLNDLNDAMVICARCFTRNSVPWTACGDIALNGRQATPNVLSDHFSDGTGYADKNFTMTCKSCSQINNHDSLCVGKFLKDVRHLLDEDVLMPGTLFDSRSGLPLKSTKSDATKFLPTFPSRLLRAGLGADILRYCNAADSLKMTSIRSYIEGGLRDKKLMQVARGSLSFIMLRDERVLIRRMMSRYWGNSSSFALDLAGAVTRQGEFVEKMHDIDWLHSPALPSTMHRLVVKYIRFVDIMKDKNHMAVPTLDVDLAWHTHQLSPLSYFQYTVAQTGQFIDHDDKVAEAKLTDAFAWTSKTYQKLYNEPYSECTCWYCEAIRESHTSAASRMFRTSSATVTDAVHKVEEDPRKSIHVSAHNVVRPTDTSGIYSAVANQRAQELEKHYLKTCSRAEKRRPKPRRDDYTWSEAWGYPVYLPMYMPLYGAAFYTGGMYPVNPGCMALGAGAVGNCCSGTCGGAVAAGGACAGVASAACAGSIGGTVGSCAGASAAGGACGGGGGGGGCGGGGGGGCGGGKSSLITQLICSAVLMNHQAAVVDAKTLSWYTKRYMFCSRWNLRLSRSRSCLSIYFSTIQV